ncbi:MULTISPECIES: hypothetical protein [Heyndrickxia]|uniref:hypothetical protein n=1 Tax=Heyndrickxia TaxID=2837504 RepID=UPI00163B12AE|nr:MULTISPECIES: hypothetical protein [Heyndrickxia]MED4867773.1 hypothetical protein [Weizmannia sp. CD-2023]
MFGGSLLSFITPMKDISTVSGMRFFPFTDSKGRFGPVCSVFCPFDKLKKTFRAQTSLLLSFWRHQKDSLSPDAACFVFLTGSKRQFEPRRSLFCPFDSFKKTV